MERQELAGAEGCGVRSGGGCGKGVGSGIGAPFKLASLHLLCLTSVCQRAPVSKGIESGAKMRIAVAILFFVGVFGFPSGQENLPTNHAVTPTVGLEIGQQPPAFPLSDHFGPEHSNTPFKVSTVPVL